MNKVVVIIDEVESIFNQTQAFKNKPESHKSL